MTNIETSVSQCFANVFPDIPAAEFPGRSAASLARWDSIAHVTLLSIISEEFSLDIAPDDYAELTSYLLILDYVKSQTGNA